MRRRLLLSTALIAVAAVLLLGVPLGVVGGRLLTESVQSRLEREADRAAARLARMREAGRPIDAAALAAVSAPDHRLEVQFADGRRVAGGDRAPAHGLRVAADGPAGFRAVVVVAPRDERTERLGTVWLAVGLLSVLAVGVAVVLALLQARRLSRPLERLAVRAGRVGHAGFVAEAARSGVAEVDAVERALAGADTRIADLLRAEREFSANASHQLRGPLTGLRLRLEELSQLTAGRRELDDEVAAAQAQADRLMETIEHLERLARDHEALDNEVADLAAVAREQAREAWAARFDAAGRSLDVDATEVAVVRLSGEAIRQVVDVLLDNALTHGAGETVMTVVAGEDWSRLVVEDAGRGVVAEDRELVFRRHHSAGGGSGVGLALARDLVRRAGGELSLNGRASFEAVLPVG